MEAGRYPFAMFGVECQSGWRGLYQPLLDLCTLYNVNVLQVKEKFGGLRFYAGGERFEELDGIIRAAESASYHTCEDCGEDGNEGTDAETGEVVYRATTGPSETSTWLRTLCQPCRKKWDDGRRDDQELRRFIRDTAGSS